MTAISHIRLERADVPDEMTRTWGGTEHGYHLYLPLRTDGRIDVEAWPRVAGLCHLRRFGPNRPEMPGRILRGATGLWVLDCLDTIAHEGKAGVQLANQRFVTGGHVQVNEDDGREVRFRVASVRPA